MNFARVRGLARETCEIMRAHVMRDCVSSCVIWCERVLVVNSRVNRKGQKKCLRKSVLNCEFSPIFITLIIFK